MNTILVFGAGNNAKEIRKYIDKRKNRILYYIDNDSGKWGKRVFGKKIAAPDMIQNLEYDFILIASVYWKEIKRQLVSLGVNRDKIRCPLAPIKIAQFKEEYKEIYNVYGKFQFYYKKWHYTEQFNPDWMGIFVNPYYFSRKKLYKSIVEYSHYMSGKCMDFGCGTQPYRKLLHVDQYIGVEIETEHKVRGITYYDGHHLPFEDGEFDSIISSEVFEHISNIEEIVLELNRVLKVGGIMLLTIPFAYPRHCWPFDYKRYTMQGIKHLLSNAGFECIKCRMDSSYWECIAQLKNVYWAVEMNVKNTIEEVIKILATTVNNINGIIVNKILPHSDILYLDNVVVVRKMKDKSVKAGRTE